MAARFGSSAIRAAFSRSAVARHETPSDTDRAHHVLRTE
jgi:hypothetical protein